MARKVRYVEKKEYFCNPFFYIIVVLFVWKGVSCICSMVNKLFDIVSKYEAVGLRCADMDCSAHGEKSPASVMVLSGGDRYALQSLVEKRRCVSLLVDYSRINTFEAAETECRSGCGSNYSKQLFY